MLNTYPFYSGISGAFFKAKIFVRIAFETVSDSAPYSHLVPWQDGKYLAQQYQKMLQALGVGQTPFYSPWLTPELLREKRAELSESYFLFHLASAEPEKDFPLSFWQELYRLMRKEGHTIYFTGKGEEQKRAIAQIVEEREHNLCDQLDWSGFIQTIAHAQLLISVDTAAVHLAAAVHTPFLVLYRATPDCHFWYPSEAYGDFIVGEMTPREVQGHALQLLELYAPCR